MKKQFASIIASLLVGVIYGGAAFGNETTGNNLLYESMGDSDNVVNTEKYKDYIFQIRLNNNDEGNYSFLVFKKGKQIYKKDSDRQYYFGHVDDDAKNKYDNIIKIGTDITGKGIPNLVLSEWTGGTHCCFNTYVYEIGKDFKLLAVIDAGHSDISHFEKRNENKYVYVTYDWAFAYWKTSFAGSPAPEVLLILKNNKYHLALDLMRKSPPSETELNHMVDEIKSENSWKDGSPPPLMWANMLDLIYTGNSKIAWLVFDRSWDASIPGKLEFKKEFMTELSKSIYWSDLKEILK